MFSRFIKIEAQRILLTAHSAAVGVVLLSVLMQGFCLIAAGFCVWILFDLRNLLPPSLGSVQRVGLYGLFSLAFCAALLLCALFSVLRSRWFYRNSKKPQYFRDYFAPLSLRTLVRSVALFFMSKAAGLFGAVFYFLPFFAALGVFFFQLRKSGVSKTIFIFWLVFLPLLGLLCLVYFAAYRQQFSIWQGLLVELPHTSVFKIQSMSRALTEPHAAEMLACKWSFLWWILPCLLVLPCLYAIPYYLQTSALLAYRLLKAEKLTEKEPLPIIFRLLPCKAMS